MKAMAKKRMRLIGIESKNSVWLAELLSPCQKVAC